MTTKRCLSRLVATGVTTLALAALLAACGGEDGEKKAHVPSAAIPEAERAPSRSMTQARESAKVLSAPAAQLREKIELPDYYPADAPVYPGATASQSSQAPTGRVNVMFGSEDPPEKIAQHMETQLSAEGWASTGRQSLPGGTALQGTKPGRLISIVLSRFDEGGPGEISLIAVAVDP